MTFIEISSTRRIMVHHGLFIPQFRYNSHAANWWPWIIDGNQIECTSESDARNWVENMSKQ